MYRWGQIAILTALADYKAGNGKEAEGICDRVLPRLQHANGAVVLAAIKVKAKKKTIRDTCTTRKKGKVPTNSLLLI